MTAPVLKYAIGNHSSTTEANSISNTDITLPIDSDTNFQAKEGEGMVLIEEATATEELAYATGITDSILDIPLVNRGLEGGIAQPHTIGATVRGILTAGMWNSVIDSMCNVVLKTTGALDTTKVVDLTSEQTLTNKTLTSPVLTSPVINTGVSGTAILDEDTMTSDSATKLATQQSIKAYVDSSTDGVVDGWISSGETWTYASDDDPTFTFTISGDKTGKYSVGMKLKLTQTTVKYFIITKIAYSSPNTTVTVYGGTDYNLANAAITLPYYSMVKTPHGFPLEPDKWTVSGGSDGTQATPTDSVTYNIGGSIDIPIGCWNVYYNASSDTNSNDDNVYIYVTSGLSTATDSFSDSTMASYLKIYMYGTAGFRRIQGPVIRDKILTLAAKTTYYLNSNAQFETQVDSMVLYKVNIKAVCVYL